MKKILAILLVLALTFSLAACSKKPKHDAMIKEAIGELKDHWKDLYDEDEDSDLDPDRYFEIKNTRVITLKDNDIEEFDLKDIAYIVEFEIYTDYFGSAPYYVNPGMHNNIVVYKDGDMKVQSSVINKYRNITYNTDYSDFIESIDDCHGAYNCAEKLK